MITVFVPVTGSTVTMSPLVSVAMTPLRAGPNGGGRGRCVPGGIDADVDAAALVDAAGNSTMAVEVVAATLAEAAGAVGADEGLVDAAAQAPTDIATMTATLALKTSEA